MNIFDVARAIKEQANEVGIEIEVEGENMPNHIVGWKRVHDGSLRGESGEYVLKQPVKRERIRVVLKRIEDAYKEVNFKFKPSVRQSVHVHINCQEMTFTKIYNFIILYLILEDLLVEFCGEHRVGNFYCLRSKDAEGLLTILELAADKNRLGILQTDKIRYSSLNVSSLFKYGSLEFRAMRGTDDFQLIEDWVKILLRLKDVAMEYDTPIDIINTFSMEGTQGFVDHVLGKKYSNIIRVNARTEGLLYEGVRRVQDIVYNGDWVGLAKDQKNDERRIQDRLAVDAADRVVGDIQDRLAVDAADRVVADMQDRLVADMQDRVGVARQRQRDLRGEW